MEAMQLVVTGAVSLVGFSLGFISGAVYALRSVRKAIDGTSRVKR